MHRGHIEPAHLLDVDVAGRSAFVCSRCGEVFD